MRRMLAFVTLGLALLPRAGAAHPYGSPLVEVGVDVGGRSATLYPAPDGSGRLYLEARAGAAYAIRLQNRTGERMAVQLVVDGLNVIDGHRETVGTPAGRMYVLDPWSSTTVSGWRTSLEEVRRFTFVDERRSYAARTGQANGHLGWIEAAVYREQRRARLQQEDAAEEAQSAPPRAAGRAKADNAPAAAGAFPGTGWGRRVDDHVELTRFEAEPVAAQQVTLRYEYASTLRALGIPVPSWNADRLREREQGQLGFARPPSW
jgi:hypothetical protein